MTARTYLVTGGAGFIGSNLVHRTLELYSDARVVVLDKLTYAGNLENLANVRESPRFEFVHGDICDRAALLPLLTRIRPSVIFNLAAESHVDRSIDAPGEFIHTNVVGTFELLNAARAHYGSLAEPERQAFRFVHVSTDEVFGSLGDAGRFDEESRYAPNSPYAASKAAADHLVRAWHQTFELPTLTTNCSNNYGPFQFPEKLVPLVTLNALENKPLPVYGDGRNVRDWLFVRDHCDGLLRVAELGVPGESYNIGGNCEKTTLEMVQAICGVLDELTPRNSGSYSELIRFVPDRPGHDHRYAIDPSKLGRELGWHPTTTFADGLGQTVRWYLANRAWCEQIERNRYGRERLGLGPPLPENKGGT